MPIIDSASQEYDSLLDGIRLLVNNAYEDADLSDERIENDVFLGRFNREVAISVPGYETISTEKRSLLQNAVQLKVAAQILWSEGRLTREDVEREQAEYTSASIEAIIDDYRNQADDIIAYVVPPEDLVNTTVSAFQPVFKVINPKKRF